MGPRDVNGDYPAAPAICGRELADAKMLGHCPAGDSCCYCGEKWPCLTWRTFRQIRHAAIRPEVIGLLPLRPSPTRRDHPRTERPHVAVPMETLERVWHGLTDPPGG